MADIFDINGNAKETALVTVYGVSPATGELNDTYDVRILAGTGIPGFSTVIAPPAAEVDKALVFEDGRWQQVIDNRGRDAFCCENGEVSKIDYLGELRQGFTLMAPVTAYDKWDGEKWVTDPAVQQQALIADALHQKEALLSRATQHIALWQTKLLMGRKLSDADAASLNAWLDYIDALQAVDISSLALRAGFIWPDAPALQSAQVSKKE